MAHFYDAFYEKYGKRNLVEEYFEKNYFSQKEFLVNFFSRKHGMRWNGRFKKFISKNRDTFAVEAFKSSRKDAQTVQKKGKRVEEFSFQMTNHYQRLQTQNEEKAVRIAKEKQIKLEIDQLFEPFFRPKVRRVWVFCFLFY